jgi:hypothetical protein
VDKSNAENRVIDDGEMWEIIASTNKLGEDKQDPNNEGE